MTARRGCCPADTHISWVSTRSRDGLWSLECDNCGYHSTHRTQDAVQDAVFAHLTTDQQQRSAIDFAYLARGG